MRVLLFVLVACKGAATPTPPPDCQNGFADRDGDGFGDPLRETSSCAERIADNSADCDDLSFDVRPDAAEVCDGVDNDCDALVDLDDDSLTDAVRVYEDLDGDTYGTGEGSLTCDPGPTPVTRAGDCDDQNAAVNPEALEVCDGGVDNNCNGSVDDADPTLDALNLFYADIDGDGFGAGSPIPACEQPLFTSPSSTDCDDMDAEAFPGALELCDGLDQNCDGNPDAPPFAIDPCDTLEGTYEGTYTVTLTDGGTTATCTGPLDLQIDRGQTSVVEGSFTCTLDAPQGSWASVQTGTLTGRVREDGLLLGDIEAFEGVSYTYEGSVVSEVSLSATGDGLFISGVPWDLELTMQADYLDIP